MLTGVNGALKFQIDLLRRIGAGRSEFVLSSPNWVVSARQNGSTRNTSENWSQVHVENTNEDVLTRVSDVPNFEGQMSFLFRTSTFNGHETTG